MHSIDYILLASARGMFHILDYCAVYIINALSACLKHWNLYSSEPHWNGYRRLWFSSRSCLYVQVWERCSPNSLNLRPLRGWGWGGAEATIPWDWVAGNAVLSHLHILHSLHHILLYILLPPALYILYCILHTVEESCCLNEMVKQKWIPPSTSNV